MNFAHCLKMNTKDKSQNIVDITPKAQNHINQGLILPQVHKLFIKGLKPAIRDYYDKLDDTLFDMAEKAENNEKQTHYFEAMREVRKKKELMVRKFSENVQQVFKLFKQAKFDYFNEQTTSDQEDMDSLSLVDEKELDQKLAVTNLVDKSNTYFHQHLYAFEKRFTLLAGGTEIEVNQIPIAPAVIVNSFVTSFDQLNIDDTIHLIMLKLFERSLIQNLVNPYQAINKYLVDEGILPNLKFRVGGRGSQRAPMPNTAPPSAEAPIDHAMMPVDEGHASEPAGVAPAMITDANYHAITAALSQRHAGMVQASNNIPVFDPSIVSNALSLLQIEELNSLNSRQASLSPTQIKDELLSRLKDMDHEGANKQVKQQDEDTIDLVGMLFQFLVDDRNLPDRIQALLAKLQIPYLHLALKDRKLFANRDNNARKLLDIIAQASIGWNEEDDKRGKFINKVESIVQNILETDHDNLDFPTLIEDFQSFTAKNSKRSEVIEKRTSEKALGQERIIRAKEQTAQILESRMKKHSLPKLVTELLLTPWANVLILAHLRHKDEPEKITGFIKFVDRLIFVSVKNKKNMATNAQISHVCDQLSKGLRLVAFDELSIKEKTQELYQMLLTINGIDNDTDTNEHEFVLPQEAFHVEPEAETEQPEIVHFIANKKINNPDAEIIHLDDDYFEQAKNLETGQWVEFLSDEADDDHVRAKLSWISPISQKLLFVNVRGVKVTDKSVDELAHDLREQQAVVLQQIPLFDRAMTAIAQQVAAEKDNEASTEEDAPQDNQDS